MYAKTAKEPAAFRRLCVETSSVCTIRASITQPPSGGCVLKPVLTIFRCGAGCAAAFRRLCVETSAKKPNARSKKQPPSGGCVLKQLLIYACGETDGQPPSGGCVLKHRLRETGAGRAATAAFRRLCVETARKEPGGSYYHQPPSGGCVLKLFKLAHKMIMQNQPPSGGCVLKLRHRRFRRGSRGSRLQAAVC